jgi:acyl-CoA hydrolase
MYADAYVAMSKAGKINGSCKSIDKYKQVYSFALGTQEMYDFLDDNPGLSACAIDYTNDPSVIAQIDDFVSINAAVEMDLFGQVCSESIGTKQVSGTGGQLDFVIGAYHSNGGQSFVCLPSTVSIKGNVSSRIKPTITPGGIITDPRSCTDMVVTEYGIAKMKGQNTWQRAENLINVAHPDFRDELIEEAEKMNIWRKCNKEVFV